MRYLGLLVLTSMSFAKAEDLRSTLRRKFQNDMGYRALRSAHSAMLMHSDIEKHLRANCGGFERAIAQPILSVVGDASSALAARQADRRLRELARLCFGERAYELSARHGLLTKTQLKAQIALMKPRLDTWVKGGQSSALSPKPSNTLQTSNISTRSGGGLSEMDGLDPGPKFTTLCDTPDVNGQTGQVYQLATQFDFIVELPDCGGGTYPSGIRVSKVYKAENPKEKAPLCRPFVDSMTTVVLSGDFKDCRNGAPAPTGSPSPEPSESPSPGPSESPSPDPSTAPSPSPSSSPTGECHGKAYEPSRHIQNFSPNWGTNTCTSRDTLDIEYTDPPASCTQDPVIHHQQVYDDQFNAEADCWVIKIPPPP